MRSHAMTNVGNLGSPAVAAFVGILSLAPCGASAGLVWNAEVISPGGVVQRMRVLSADKKFKVLEEGGSGQYLVRLDRDEMYWIDSKKRSYQVFKLSELQRAAKGVQQQMRVAMSKMKEELKHLPPEQRALMEQMMGSGAGSGGQESESVEVKKTGVEKTIAGYRCEEYVVRVGGKERLKACTTEQIPGFSGMRGDWVVMQKRLAEVVPFWGGKGHGEWYGRLSGFPLESEMGGVRAVVTKVEVSDPPTSEFEIPAGYERRPGPPLLDAR